MASYWQDLRFFADSLLGRETEAESLCLYEGDGSGQFREVAAERALARRSMPMGANFGDLDNDGYADFYFGTGFPDYSGLMPNAMYWNRGGTRFDDVTTAGGFGHLQKGHGVVFADFDNDGDQDIFEQLGGAYPGDPFGDVLFKNPGFGNHFLTIKLVGTESNRSAIGTRVHAVLKEGESQRSIYTWVNSGGSFGANPLRCELGLGKSESVERLEVYWPKSDKTQVFHEIAADQFLVIREGAQQYEVITP